LDEGSVAQRAAMMVECLVVTKGGNSAALKAVKKVVSRVEKRAVVRAVN